MECLGGSHFADDDLLGVVDDGDDLQEVGDGDLHGDGEDDVCAVDDDDDGNDVDPLNHGDDEASIGPAPEGGNSFLAVILLHQAHSIILEGLKNRAKKRFLEKRGSC